jgi:polyphosphate glucokinase
MKVLVIDVGGTHVKLLASGYRAPRKLESGSFMTPARMVRGIKALVVDWSYEAVSMGYPGLVLNGRIASEPHNLGGGWVGFDFAKAFGCPVVILNDAAMQALGSYRKGRMLFLGLGTGLGSAMITDGLLEPMELAHLPYKKGRTYEDYVGRKGLKRLGKRKWRRHVADVVSRLRAALEPDDLVIGGGNAKKLDRLPPGARLCKNADAFVGGFRVWSSKTKTRAGRATQVPSGYK